MKRPRDSVGRGEGGQGASGPFREPAPTVSISAESGGGYRSLDVFESLEAGLFGYDEIPWEEAAEPQAVGGTGLVSIAAERLSIQS